MLEAKLLRDLANCELVVWVGETFSQSKLACSSESRLTSVRERLLLIYILDRTASVGLI